MVREDGFFFRLRTNRLLPNAVLLVRSQLAVLGLNSFQAAACEAQRQGQPSSSPRQTGRSPRARTASTRPRSSSFWTTFCAAPPLRRGGSIAQWSSRCEAADRTLHLGLGECRRHSQDPPVLRRDPRAGTTAAPLRHRAGGAGSLEKPVTRARTPTLPLGSQQNASPFCDHLWMPGLITVWLPVRVLLYRGGLVSSAFRLLRRSGVGCHSQDPRFSSGSALWPSHDGIRRMRRTNLPRRPCRKTYGRHKDSKRTRLIHRPCGDIAPPVGGIHVFSCRVLLCTTRCEIRHDARHKCALTARSLLFAQSR